MKTKAKRVTKCPYCFKNVKGASSKMRQHINMVHLKLRPYQCDYCDFKFGSACNKKDHMRRKHGAI